MPGRFAIGMLALALIGALACLRSSGSDRSRENPPAEMRVVTYNVLADEVHVRERAPELFRILRESGADIIALQEVSPWFAARLLREEWVAGYQRAMQDGRTLLAREFIILSKFPVIDHAVIALPSRQRRTAFRVTLDIAGTRTAVVTTHLDSFLEDGPIRVRQLDAIFAHLADFEEAIFAGDFNFGHGEQPDSAHLSAEFCDAWLAVHPDDPGFTWDIKKSPWARRESFPGEPSRRLDRVLVKSTRWMPVAAGIIGDEAIGGKRSEIFPSDHFGLSVDLQVAGAH